MQKFTDNYFFKVQWTRIHQFMISPVNNSILIIHLTITSYSYQNEQSIPQCAINSIKIILIHISKHK